MKRIFVLWGLPTFPATLIFSFTGNAIEDLHLDEQNLGLLGMERDFENDSPTLSNSISAGLASAGEFSLPTLVVFLFEQNWVVEVGP